MSTAARLGLLNCETCSMLNRAAPGRDACARCGTRLHARLPASVTRTWAYLIAAAILYVPANTMPVIESGSLFLSQSDTIMSGVRYLWRTGSHVLAIIIFVASVLIPAGKLVSLMGLLLAVQRGSRRNPLALTRIYRATHYIGRWSMVDIYVGAMLVGLVQFKAFATIVPGPGAVYFAAVVVLTMLASSSFDPRLMWDALEAEPVPGARPGGTEGLAR
jgi:paraquat-inducible protein A